MISVSVLLTGAASDGTGAIQLKCRLRAVVPALVLAFGVVNVAVGWHRIIQATFMIQETSVHEALLSVRA